MVEESYMPVTLFVSELTDEAFREWCDQYPDYRQEYSAGGELIIMPLVKLEAATLQLQNG